MPPLNGGTDEETYNALHENIVGDGNVDNESEAIDFCVRYTLQHKYGIDV